MMSSSCDGIDPKHCATALYMPLHHFALDQEATVSWPWSSLSSNTIETNNFLNYRIYGTHFHPLTSVSLLEHLLKDIFWDSFMNKFDPNNSCTYYFSCLCPRYFSQPGQNHASTVTVIIHQTKSVIIFMYPALYHCF